MPRLTDTEKQDIIRHLEAGKPLPEKYRGLLFDDKREVELVWNGKTNEVCNVVLPFQTIEHVDEPRSEDATARARPRGRSISSFCFRWTTGGGSSRAGPTSSSGATTS